MDVLIVIAGFLKQVVVTALLLFWELFEVITILGLVLYFFSRMIRITYIKAIGPNFDIYFTGWIGTPVHELGHAIFCILFGHKITDMKLFSPNSEDGSLGYVKHSWEPKSIFQSIGNFFIGMGPLFTGVIAIYLSLYFLVPESGYFLTLLSSTGAKLVKLLKNGESGIALSFFADLKYVVVGLFSKHWFDYRFYIFVYLAVCISSHMQLSIADLKTSLKGIFILMILLLIWSFVITGVEYLALNRYLGGVWKYFKPEIYNVSYEPILAKLSSFILLALFLIICHFIVMYTILSVVHLFRGKGFINPLKN